MEGARARYAPLSPKERERIAYEWYLISQSDDMYAHTAMFLFNKAHAEAYTILAYWISLVRTYGVSQG